MPAKNWLALLLCLGLVGCGEPIVPRTPEAFHNLAKQQLTNGQYRAAADSLQRVTEMDPTGELGRRALVLRIALLGGMIRGFQSIGEDYLAGYQQTKSAELRTVAMDYFSRARGRSLELLDGLEQALKQPTTSPFRVDYWPAPAAGGEALQKARHGQTLSETELTAAERAAVQRSLAEVLSGLTGKTGAPGEETDVEPAIFFLGAAQELVRMTSLFRAEALDERRLTQLSFERAATLARQAEQLAQAGGNQKVQAEAGQVLRQCEEALKRR
jgi:hypothetical protein